MCKSIFTTALWIRIINNEAQPAVPIGGRMFLKKGAISLVCGMMLGATSLFAVGNIALTGHDDDFHQSPAARAQTLGMLAFVRNGSTLKVLSFDHGTELQNWLTALAI